MPKIVRNSLPAVDISKFGIMPVIYGGTGADNIALAVFNIGAISKSTIGTPLGVLGLGDNGKIPIENLTLGTGSYSSTVDIVGNLSLMLNTTATYEIVNYTDTVNYTVQCNTGTVSIVNNIITYTAPNSLGMAGFTVNEFTIKVDVIDISSEVMVNGPMYATVNYSSVYEIVNYTDTVNYIVQCNTGTVSISGQYITYIPSLLALSASTYYSGFTINGQNISIFIKNITFNQSNGFQTLPVQVSPISTPSILSPVAGYVSNLATISFSASTYSTSSTDTHSSTNWQLATDAAFTAIIDQSLLDTTNLTTWTVTNLVVSTTYYVRAQYVGSSGATSTYSPAVTFTTAASFSIKGISARLASGVANSNFGYTVSINSTGNVAIIGANGENINTGAAYIYTLVSGTWTQTVRLATGITNSNFGYSVSINNTGNVAIISAYYENSGTGAAYIYTLVSGTWTQSARLASGVANSYFGWSVNINNTGNIAIIGAYTENSNTGAAYIYTLVSGTWTQSARLASGITNSNFGISVSMNGTGTVAIIGANFENSYTGAAYIYTLVSGTWTQTVRLATGVVNSNFGYSVSINSAGDVVIIGAIGENSATGAAYIYTLVSGTWTQTARLASGVAGSQFSISVSINSAGTVAIIGAFIENSNTGAAYIYTLVSGTWTQTARLASGAAGSQFGYSVSINSTGNVAIIGAIGENSATGAAYIAK